jgi:hypothetical protein
MGVDPAEFTTAGGEGRIHLFLGGYQAPRDGQTGVRQPVLKLDDAHGGTPLTPATELWASKDSLMKYDITMLSCEGGEYAQQKPMASRQAMYDYASAGGRVFASHWHAVWFNKGPAPVPTTGTWEDRRDPRSDNTPLTATINQTFPKGEALAKWLVNVGSSTTQGSMDVVFPRDNLQAVNDMVAREWISVVNPMEQDTKAVQYMSFNTPIGAADDKICGREVFTDLHVAAIEDNTAANAMGFPASCEVRDLSAQEKAVAFMLFDLSSCVQTKDEPSPPPK